MATMVGRRVPRATGGLSASGIGSAPWTVSAWERRDVVCFADLNQLGGLLMKYRVRYAAAAVRELEKMSPNVARRIRSKINRLSDGLAGDGKRLTNFFSGYRRRVWG